jgi:hypothetical protein
VDEPDESQRHGCQRRVPNGQTLPDLRSSPEVGGVPSSVRVARGLKAPRAVGLNCTNGAPTARQAPPCCKRQHASASRLTLSEGGHRRCPLTWSPPLTRPRTTCSPTSRSADEHNEATARAALRSRGECADGRPDGLSGRDRYSASSSSLSKRFRRLGARVAQASFRCCWFRNTLRCCSCCPSRC